MSLILGTQTIGPRFFGGRFYFAADLKGLDKPRITRYIDDTGTAKGADTRPAGSPGKAQKMKNQNQNPAPAAQETLRGIAAAEEAARLEGVPAAVIRAGKALMRSLARGQADDTAEVISNTGYGMSDALAWDDARLLNGLADRPDATPADITRGGDVLWAGVRVHVRHGIAYVRARGQVHLFGVCPDHA